MKDVDPIDCLDKALQFIIEKGGRTDFDKIAYNVTRDRITGDYYRTMIGRETVLKLEKDGHVRRENREVTITFQGLFFVQDGGYKRKIQKELANAEFSRRVDESSVHLTTLTKILAWAAGIASVYYILEIIGIVIGRF